jgi:imidazolonepropionase-like amidohydrolase
MDGLTPMQALVAATSSNARWLGARDLGVIAAGGWADLLILDANPLDDIRNTRRIAAVYVAGNPVTTIWQACRYREAADCPAASHSGPSSSH